jgi:hypothetical protein
MRSCHDLKKIQLTYRYTLPEKASQEYDQLPYNQSKGTRNYEIVFGKKVSQVCEGA